MSSDILRFATTPNTVQPDHSYVVWMDMAVICHDIASRDCKGPETVKSYLHLDTQAHTGKQKPTCFQNSYAIVFIFSYLLCIIYNIWRFTFKDILRSFRCEYVNSCLNRKPYKSQLMIFTESKWQFFLVITSEYCLLNSLK